MNKLDDYLNDYNNSILSNKPMENEISNMFLPFDDSEELERIMLNSREVRLRIDEIIPEEDVLIDFSTTTPPVGLVTVYNIIRMSDRRTLKEFFQNMLDRCETKENIDLNKALKHIELIYEYDLRKIILVDEEDYQRLKACIIIYLLDLWLDYESIAKLLISIKFRPLEKIENKTLGLTDREIDELCIPPDFFKMFPRFEKECNYISSYVGLYGFTNEVFYNTEPFLELDYDKVMFNLMALNNTRSLTKITKDRIFGTCLSLWLKPESILNIYKEIKK